MMTLFLCLLPPGADGEKGEKGAPGLPGSSSDLSASLTLDYIKKLNITHLLKGTITVVSIKH